MCTEGLGKQMAILSNKHGLCELHESKNKKKATKDQIAKVVVSQCKLASKQLNKLGIKIGEPFDIQVGNRKKL